MIVINIFILLYLRGLLFLDKIIFLFIKLPNKPKLVYFINFIITIYF